MYYVSCRSSLSSLLSLRYSDETQHQDEYPKYIHFLIKGSLNQTFSVLLKVSKDTLCKELFVKVEKITRIPRTMQLLTFRQFVLGPNRTMTNYKFGDENIVHLSVKGLGGGSTDDGIKIIIIIIITFHLCHASCILSIVDHNYTLQNHQILK